MLPCDETCDEIVADVRRVVEQGAQKSVCFWEKYGLAESAFSVLGVE